MDNIKMIVLDVDGTLTDGRLYIDNQGNELKTFYARDGLAIVNWLNLGGELAILTGKNSNIVIDRAKELGIKYVLQGSKNKTEDLKKLLKKLNLTFENVAYMGDDINDIGVMKKVFLTACPKDADDNVKELAEFISTKNGGLGAVREFLEYIMKNNGMWKKILEKYINE